MDVTREQMEQVISDALNEANGTGTGTYAVTDAVMDLLNEHIAERILRRMVGQDTYDSPYFDIDGGVIDGRVDFTEEEAAYLHSLRDAAEPTDTGNHPQRNRP